MLLRVFYGEKCKDIDLDASGDVTIGKHTKGSFDIDAADLADRHIVFHHEQGMLRAVCNGDVIYNDELYNRKKPYLGTVEPYKKFVLSVENCVSCIAMRDDVRQTTIDLSRYDNVLIGRKPGNNIRFRYALVSGKHARIKRIGSTFQIEDLGSTNGTYVNGIRVSSAVLNDEDVICIGEATLVYRGDTLGIQSNFCAVDMPGGARVDPMVTQVKFERSPRLKLTVPEGEVEIQTPPSVMDKPDINWVQVLLPSLGMVGVSLLATTLSGMNPTMLLFSAPMALIGIIVSIINYRGQIKKYHQQQDKRIATYTEYLDGVVKNIREKQSQQMRAMITADPETEECLRLAQNLDKRLWVRRPRDADFMSVRVGGGDVPSSVNIHFPHRGLSLEEDRLLDRPAELYDEYHMVHGMPITCSAALNPTIGIVGPSDKTMALLSNMIVQLATHHSYSEAKFVLLSSERQLRQLEWVKKIPHFLDDERKSAYVASNKHEASTLCDAFEKELKDRKKDLESTERSEMSLRLPFLVFFVADPSLLEGETIRRHLLNEGKNLSSCTIMLYDQLQSLPKECGTIIELKGETGEIYSKDRASERSQFTLDPMSDAQYREFARALGNIFCDENSAEAGITSSISLFEVLGIKSLDQLDLQKKWALSNVTKSLAAPLGVKEKNELVYLDLHESAHGPHGLVAGTTGSGKSEVMQSYVLAMAANFHPYEVGFVIIDFKGGGMVNQFKDLPHLIGAITDMDGKEVNRSLLSIKAELDKRKRLFAEHNVNKIDQYIELFKVGKAETPLPHLIIIVDEFAELKADQPEFMQELISAARIGRSLGVHLILATQKPAGQVNEQIWSNSKFKLCLKVQDASDSREVLKSPLAAKIKEPGRAYLKVGNDEIFELLQSGYSGIKTQYNGQIVTELAGMVQHIKTYCEKNGIRRLMPICLPPLPQLLPYPDELSVIDAQVPVGKYDAPSAQEQGTVMLDVAENTFVVGSAQTGKTNLLQSVIRTLAWNLPPSEINLYIIDFGAMTLKSFENLNHVGGVVLPDEDEKLKNLFKLLEREIEQRKKKMIASGVSSFQAYLEGGFTDIPRIVLLLDGFITFSELYGDDYDGALQHICRDGLAYGITAVVTNTQTTGFGYKYLSLFKGRLAFTCNDSSEYSNIFDHCRMEPSNFKGRCLCVVDEEILEAQAFLAFEGKKEIERTAAMRAFVEAANTRYPDKRAAVIPAIPEKLDLHYIYDHFDLSLSKYAAVVGLDYGNVDVVQYDFATLCELGIAGSVKDKKIRATQLLLASIQHRATEAAVNIHLIDSIERPLKGFKDHSSVRTYTIDFAEVGSVIDVVSDAVRERYDVLVRDGIEAMDRFPLILTVINNPSAVEFISANRDVMEGYKNIIKRAQSLKIVFLFSNLEGVGVPYGGPELLKSLKNIKNMVITDNLREFQFVEFPSTVVRGSKQLQKDDVFCMLDGEVKRTKLCGGICCECRGRQR